MPIRQGLGFHNQAVGTGLRQPADGRHVLRSQSNTVRYVLKTFIVMATATVVGVQQTTADVGKINVSTVFVFKLDQTASTAPVAEGLPLLRRHLTQGLNLPEFI